MSQFEWWGTKAPTWRTPLRWLRFKLFRRGLAARIKAKRDARQRRATDADWDRSLPEGRA